MIIKIGSKSGKTSEKKPRGKGVPFRKNNPETGEIDERINRSGIRKYDDLKHIMQANWNETIEVPTGEKDAKGKPKTKTKTLAEVVGREWIISGDYQKQNKAYEIAYGKVPDETIVHTFDVDKFLEQNIDLFTDGQLRRLKDGEDAMGIIAELLRDIRSSKEQKDK